jgi:hypothetical protein
MRKVVAVELVSLDGVIESPEEWPFLLYSLKCLLPHPIRRVKS